MTPATATPSLCLGRALPLVLVALALPASAATRKLAIVDVAAPPMMIGLGSLVTQSIVRQAERERDLTVVSPESARATLGPKGLSLVQDCAGRAECVAERAAALNVDQVVVGIFDRSPASYLVKLWLIDLKTRQVVSSVDRSILIASRRLTQDVEAAIPALLAGKAEATGRLRVTSNAKKAQVSVDGVPLGEAPCDGDFKPGKHTVHLERNGYLPVERFATVTAGKTETLHVVMIARPGFEEEELIAARKPEGPQVEARGFQVPAASFVAGGVALAAAGVGLYFGLQASDIQDRAVDNGDGYLNVTRREALAGQRGATIANACFVGAGVAVAAAVAIAVIAGRPGPEPAKSTGVTPVVTALPGGAAAGLTGSF